VGVNGYDKMTRGGEVQRKEKRGNRKHPTQNSALQLGEITNKQAKRRREAEIREGEEERGISIKEVGKNRKDKEYLRSRNAGKGENSN